MTAVLGDLTTAEQTVVASLDPLLQPIALRHWELWRQAGLPFRFVQGRRSRAEQRALDATLGPGAASADRSLHVVGAAYDLSGDDPRLPGIQAVPDSDLRWREVGMLGESLGLEWGGRFVETGGVFDAGHFQLPVTRSQMDVLQGLALLSLAAVLGVAVTITTRKG